MLFLAELDLAAAGLRSAPMYLYLCACVFVCVCVCVYELTGWLLGNKTSANVNKMVLKIPVAQ